MPTISRFLIVAGSVVLVVAAGFVVRRLGGKTPESVSSTALPEPSFPATNDHSILPSGQGLVVPASMSNQQAVGESVSTNAPSDWSDQVDAILVADRGDEEKARKLLEIFPRLPESSRIEVAAHLSNLVPNQDYHELSNLLVNAESAPDVLDVFFRDILNRPNRLKLPVLLEIARNPQHPNSADAKETLVFLLEEDEGDDWAKWQAKIDVLLRSNPD